MWWIARSRAKMLGLLADFSRDSGKSDREQSFSDLVDAGRRQSHDNHVPMALVAAKQRREEKVRFGCCRRHDVADEFFCRRSGGGSLLQGWRRRDLGRPWLCTMGKKSYEIFWDGIEENDS
jgi:hypothetical protein